MPSLLVTGASTGIGFACALRLEQHGWRVFAGVRREEDAARLRALKRPGLEPVRLEVTDRASVREARLRIEGELGVRGLDGLVNNAGVALVGLLEYVDLDELRRLYDVNVIGVLAVTQEFLPLLRRARGRIVNMSSISGLNANPFTGPYASSKFALEALNDSMRLELAHFGIHVSAVEPGMIATPIWDKGIHAAEEQRAAYPAEAEELYGDLMEGFSRLIRPAIRRAGPVDTVADAVEDALVSPDPRTRYLIGRDARLRYLLSRLLPDRVLDRLVFHAIRRGSR